MASRKATSERIDWAVCQLSQLRSTTSVVAEMAETWGLSRRQAQRLVGRAHQTLVADLEEAGVERKAVVAQLAHGLMQAMHTALKSNQPSVVVGAAKALADLLQLTHPPRRP